MSHTDVHEWSLIQIILDNFEADIDGHTAWQI